MFPELTGAYAPLAGSGKRAQRQKLARMMGATSSRMTKRQRFYARPSEYVLPAVRTRISRRDDDNRQSQTLLAVTDVRSVYRAARRRRRPDHERPSRVYRNGETAPLS